MYNVATPGFVPEHVEAIVTATVAAITEAWRSAEPTELVLGNGRFDDPVPVAWNRSLASYNRNPDVSTRTEWQTHLALDRSMNVLSFRRDGQTHALLSLFGVHATCVGNTNTRYSADNKGHAALAAEAHLAKSGVTQPVALFAQATAGDISPYYQGPGDIARRSRIQGNEEHTYAERNGNYQTEQALAIVDSPNGVSVDGDIDTVFTYIDFTALKAEPRFANGNLEAYTSEPCHGVAFFTGTRVDGPGMPVALGVVAKKAARWVKQNRLGHPEKQSPEDRDYYRRLYAAQGPKDILLEAGRKQVLGQPIAKLMVPGFADPLVGEMKRQAKLGAMTHSAMVPTVLPLQIIRLGPLALVCCPGEFTTVAGQRVVQAVREALQPAGVQQVLICTYCNDYMGYVTTYEEYQEQAYEGGHTIFGQWTLAAFQTQFAGLARELLKPNPERSYDRTTRPQAAPADELALRTQLAVPMKRPKNAVA
jgi:neutral ceramidase